MESIFGGAGNANKKIVTRRKKKKKKREEKKKKNKLEILAEIGRTNFRLSM